jgi:hypothetical protein
MPDPARLVLPPGESARLAATRPGEVVEVRCGKPLPLVPHDYEYVSVVRWLLVATGSDGEVNHAFPQPRHPAPAVGAEVWVPEGWRYTSNRTGTQSHPPYEYEADYRGVRNTGEWRDAESMPIVAARLRATVTALGARQYDCEECGGAGTVAGALRHLRGSAAALAVGDLPGAEAEMLSPCPTCQGTPPWWATVALRREGA